MKLTKNSLLCFLIFTILLTMTSCIVLGDQIIYEDPEHVDFDPESPPKDENRLESVYGDMQYIEAGDVRIYYDESIEDQVEDTSETVPSSSGEDLYGVAHPDFVFFNFSAMQARIYVARVDLYESAADFAPGIIADLQRMVDGIWVFDGCIPELPMDEFYRTCDHQEFTSNIKLIDFGNGSGVRYISVYAIQDFAPVDNRHLEYIFQGLTDDGRYYVKVIVEMMHSSLEGTDEIPAEIYTGSTEEVTEYFASFRENFEDNEAGFTPDLNWIDEVIGGLFFE